MQLGKWKGDHNRLAMSGTLWACFDPAHHGCRGIPPVAVAGEALALSITDKPLSVALKAVWRSGGLEMGADNVAISTATTIVLTA